MAKKPVITALEAAKMIPDGATIMCAGIIMGGNVRVGFEDNVYLGKGHKAASNGELVEKVVRLAKELGREIATPDEARAILSMPPRQ